MFTGRGREGKREGEKHQSVVASHVPLLGTWPTTQACALTGNRTCNPLVHRLAFNPLSHTSQGEFLIFEGCHSPFVLTHLQTIFAMTIPCCVITEECLFSCFQLIF